ncbi:hypothetical protein GGI12_001322 [Dipsacomyces acuminosporus]|nr:hypothetical protein GGI12_001322 [Dipsacomyces acuminosporus]
MASPVGCGSLGNSGCPECGSEGIIESCGDAYCGDCGAVVDSLVLTSNYSYEAEQAQASNRIYFRLHATAGMSEKASDRLNKRWNQNMLQQINDSISNMCAQLGMVSIESRAQRLFLDMVQRMIDSLEAHIFGRQGEIRAAACVYIAGIESGKSLTLVNIASVAYISVYIIGRAVRDVLRLLDMQLPLADPLLRVEKIVNRVFGQISLCEHDAEAKAALLSQISATAKSAAGFPSVLLGFMSADSELRPKLIEMTGKVMEFDRACNRHTGNNPNSLACAAAAVAIEHFFLAADSTTLSSIKRGQRDVIYKLVALPNGSSEHTLVKHVRSVLDALASASAATPWLADIKVTADNAAVYLPDILSCYTHARSFLFALRPESIAGSSNTAKGLAKVVAKLSEVPSYKRARLLRERRLAILKSVEPADPNAPLEPKPSQKQAEKHGDDDVQEKEVAILRQLRLLGVDCSSLLTLPLSTLQEIASAASRNRDISGKGQDLDSPTVGPEDMNDQELHAYLHQAGPAT